MNSAATGYLVDWASIDYAAMNMFRVGRTLSDEVAINWINNVAIQYAVARNFKTYDGNLRFENFWEQFKGISTLGDPAITYARLLGSLHTKYKMFLWSAASKFLWIRFGSPIVIYDTLAYKWIRHHRFVDEPSAEITEQRAEWYRDYCSAWRDLFNADSAQSSLAIACEHLLCTYGEVIPDFLNREIVEMTIREPWFQERIFDRYCVDRGDEMSRKAT